MSWHAARGWCMENGADLVSILSAEEQNFTLHLVSYTEQWQFVIILLKDIANKVNLFAAIHWITYSKLCTKCSIG